MSVTLSRASNETNESYFVSGDQQYPKRIFASMHMAGRRVTFQLDCGASCNVMRRHDLPDTVHIEPTEQILKVYNGATLTLMGVYAGEIQNPAHKRVLTVQFIVLKEAPSSLLGAQTCQEMDLLQIHRHNIEVPVYSLASATSLSQERILSEFRDVFDKALGCFEGEVALQLEQSSQPVQMPLRRFPVAVQEDLRTELARLVKLGVLAKVEAPSAWVSSLVVGRKRTGKIRTLC